MALGCAPVSTWARLFCCGYLYVCACLCMQVCMQPTLLRSWSFAAGTSPTSNPGAFPQHTVGRGWFSNRTHTWLCLTHFYPVIMSAVPLLLSSGVSVASGGSAGLQVTGKPVHPRWVERDWVLPCAIAGFLVHPWWQLPVQEVQSGFWGIILAAEEALHTLSLWCGCGRAVPGRRRVPASAGVHRLSQGDRWPVSSPAHHKASLPTLVGHLQVRKNDGKDGHGPNQLEDDGHSWG